MTIRDREVLEELRDDPELLAIADAVVETQRLRRGFRPWIVVTVVALAAALFLLVLASPWDRGGGQGPLLDRALAAIPSQGPVTHMTIRPELTHGERTFSPISTESFYDEERGLVRLITRGEGEVLADYTTTGAEDEFSTFPGLFDGAALYRQALATGRARVVDQGVWEGRPVHWLQLNDVGGPGILRIGIDRESYEPVVVRGVNRDGSPDFQAAILGFDYVSTSKAAFQTDAPILVSGKVLGPNCRPIRARVGVSFGDIPTGSEPRLSVDVASVRTGVDGRFTLRADPIKTPFREALARVGKENGGRLNFDLNAMSADGAFGYRGFPRFVQNGEWWGNQKENHSREPVTVTVAKGISPKCD